MFCPYIRRPALSFSLSSLAPGCIDGLTSWQRAGGRTQYEQARNGEFEGPFPERASPGKLRLPMAADHVAR